MRLFKIDCSSLLYISSTIQDMDAFVCRRTLTGHRNDVLCISGVDILPSRPVPNGRSADGADDTASTLSQVISGAPS